MLGIVSILFVYFLQNFQDQESFDISLLEENKTNSKEEAIEIGQILAAQELLTWETPIFLVLQLENTIML